jgi:hypothetical protein
MSSRLTWQHMLGFVNEFTPDRYLGWLNSKKIKISTSTAAQYSVIVWLS